jgi:FecR protein.
LRASAGHRAYRFGLKVGKTWHRVSKLSGTQNRYEVETSNAVAAVRGTTFMVECPVLDTCTITSSTVACS